MQHLRQLPRFKERSFYVNDFSWEESEIKALYHELFEQQVNSENDAITWINKWQELTIILLDEQVVRYLQAKAETQNKEYERESKYFEQKISPKIEEQEFLIRKKIFTNQFLNQLLRNTKAFCFKQMQTDYELFNEKNIPVSVELRELSNQYTKLLSNQTICWEGKTVTTQSLQKELTNPNPEVRKKIWLACAERQYQDKQAIDAIFNKMISLRNTEAQNAGYRVVEYNFAKKHRYDYTPEDCQNFHNLILQHFLPIEKKVTQKGIKNLKLDFWRPWDVTVDIMGSQPVKLFEDAKDLIQKTLATFSELDEELGSFFSQLIEAKTLDIDNRPGKRPGALQVPLLESNIPFIFMNTVGISKDVMLLFHETGHAFHVFLTRHLDLLDRNVSRDFSEIPSMAMELLTLDHLEKSFGASSARQLKQDQLLYISRLMLRVACIDEFEQWVYENNEGQSADARDHKWLELMKKYSPHLNFEGVEKFVGTSWQNVLHLFYTPFYMIDYGFAQLGAMQFWKKYSQNRANAITTYKQALSAGGTLGLKDLLKLSGLEFSIDEKVVANLAKMLTTEIDTVLA